MIETYLAKAEDAADLLRLHMLFNEAEAKLEELAQRLSQTELSDKAILAKLDNEVLGFAVLRLIPTLLYGDVYAEVTELFVEERARSKGLGRALMTHAEILAQEAGATEVVLLTGDDNYAALAFYQRLNYETHDIALIKAL